MKKGFIILCLFLLGHSVVNASKRMIVQYDNGVGLEFKIISKTDMTVMMIKGNWAAKQVETLEIPNIVEFEGQKFWVTQLDQRLCLGWEKLKKVVLPSSIRIIGESAFENCINLEEINFPDGLVRIGKEAFKNTNLISISIPNSARYIDKNAFKDCLPNVIIENLPDYITFENCMKYGLSRENLASYYNRRTAKKRQQNENDLASTAQNEKTHQPQAAVTTPKNHAAIPVQQQDKRKQQIVAPVPQESELTTSDVDMDIPTTKMQNENMFAIIFANENYKKLAHVDCALNDGRSFKNYCQQVLGIPTENIKMVEDATYGEMTTQIDWLANVAKAYKGNARIIIYYAGHGIPSESDNTPYMLPVDNSGNNLSAAYSIKKLYKQLGAMPAQNITVFLDACFSGTKRGEDGMLTAARSVAMAYQAAPPLGHMVVFSASQGNETAYSYKQQGHGLFTYFLLKKLKETKGAVNYGTLGEYIEEMVSKKAIVVNGKPQTPSVAYSKELSNKWRYLTFK